MVCKQNGGPSPVAAAERSRWHGSPPFDEQSCSAAGDFPPQPAANCLCGGAWKRTGKKALCGSEKKGRCGREMHAEKGDMKVIKTISILIGARQVQTKCQQSHRRGGDDAMTYALGYIGVLRAASRPPNPATESNRSCPQARSPWPIAATRSCYTDTVIKLPGVTRVVNHGIPTPVAPPGPSVCAEHAEPCRPAGLCLEDGTVAICPTLRSTEADWSQLGSFNSYPRCRRGLSATCWRQLAGTIWGLACGACRV